MPSPFPGMDPYLEISEWSNFHFDLIAEIKDQLQPLVFPNYLVVTETRVYLERNDGDTLRFIPDVGLQPTGSQARPSWSGASTAVAEIEPQTYYAVMPEEHREHYLVLRDRGKNELVTVIEVLSPTNKLPGSDGHKEYYLKRERLLQIHANLIEIDLLRGGQRPRLNRPLKPTTDYCVFLHRAADRPKVLAWEFTIRHGLPEIPVPLSDGDPDVLLNLQAAFASLYDRLGYSMRIPYHQPLAPPLRESDVDWVREHLQKLPPQESNQARQAT